MYVRMCEEPYEVLFVCHATWTRLITDQVLMIVSCETR